MLHGNVIVMKNSFLVPFCALIQFRRIFLIRVLLMLYFFFFGSDFVAVICFGGLYFGRIFPSLSTMNLLEPVNLLLNVMHFNWVIPVKPTARSGSVVYFKLLRVVNSFVVIDVGEFFYRGGFVSDFAFRLIINIVTRLILREPFLYKSMGATQTGTGRKLTG